jgi:hypothetical protein
MKQSPNSFTTYTLVEEEQKLADQLSSLTVASISNLRSNIAHEILALTYNPLNPLEFQQQDSYLKGQLAILSYLLDCNEAAHQYHHTETPN